MTWPEYGTGLRFPSAPASSDLMRHAPMIGDSWEKAGVATESASARAAIFNLIVICVVPFLICGREQAVRPIFAHTESMTLMARRSSRAR
ncbi:hypothetical protein X743_10370 [Mesorhizobium sp. LNHC252B00]|nr:hypothetical protein X743_10370 [Mesorhizobium sp. LNHC252B00]